MISQIKTKSSRDNWVDFLKGIAMIAVVLYHFKLLEYGYLGVEIFLVINGYLLTNSLNKKISAGKKFSYFKFVYERLVRLWPLVLVAGLISLIVGSVSMLPDDYENLAQSVVASNVFSNNILAAITTGNYWDVVQDYKPLMHLWYIGILVPFYVIYPAIHLHTIQVARKKKYDDQKSLLIVNGVLAILSLTAYFFENETSARFYYFPFRFYEMLAGCLVATSMKYFSGGIKRISNTVLGIVFLVFLLIINPYAFITGHNTIRLLAMVFFAAGLLWVRPSTRFENNAICRIVAVIGMASYSIYIWHQVIIAFYRYIVDASPSFIGLLICLIITVLISYVSYCWMEKKFAHLRNRIIISISLAICACTTICSLYLYAHAGVIRDVPELDVYTDNVHRGMHAEYCDRVYDMNRPFTNDSRAKVLVVGHSFARDWVNVLLEAGLDDSLDIVYIYTTDISENDIDRIQQADYIFVNAERAVTETIPEIIITGMREGTQLWGIGTKSFGENNGNIYNRRYFDNYYELTASYDLVKETYEEEKSIWGNNYIDFIEPILQENGEVTVFTDAGKYISQDCRHLTRAGAQYYARLFDFTSIFGEAI
jgi:peptidoglycan/LPS O-acetylase OafA/YrhL